MVDRFGDVAAIRDALLVRDDLPAATRQNLVTRLSQNACRLCRSTAPGSRRIAPGASPARLARRRRSRSPPAARRPNCGRSFAISARAVSSPPAWSCALFEEALAELSGIPLSRVSALVHDRFGSGLRPLFEKAQLPASMHAAFKEAIKAMRDGLAEDTDDARLQRRMVERVLAACESADTGDIAPLITLLRRFATEAAREEARLFCDEIAEPPRLVYSTAA